MSFIIKVLVGTGAGQEYVAHELGATYKTKEQAESALATLARLGEKRIMMVDEPKRGRPFGSKNLPKPEAAMPDRITLSSQQVAKLIASIHEKKKGSGEYVIILPLGALVQSDTKPTGST